MKIESIPFDIKEELRKMTKVHFSDCDLSHRACVTKITSTCTCICRC
jgi:hypothetical protein